jgi:flavin reductase ActVB
MPIEPVRSATFCEALAQFASGVTVVTAAGADGPVGITATGFSSASLAPPLVLVCIGKRATAHGRFLGTERFGVSILSERQAWIAQQFARSGIDRFRDVPLRDGCVPLIGGALASLDCRRYGQHDAGDHTILLGEVLETFLGPGRPLVHHARRFGAFAEEARP